MRDRDNGKNSKQRAGGAGKQAGGIKQFPNQIKNQTRGRVSLLMKLHLLAALKS